MKDEMSCPITLGQYERFIKNKKVYETLDELQVMWLDAFLTDNKYSLKNIVLKKDEYDALWVIINTKNSVRQFEGWGC
jgi:hypothetical protein